ncbi:M16 family metallopeptidase [Azonexus fungiphilus]|uniref:M16 family metallopeptidase n=1 Tax=Azonexus fungiphilus TaxID=146940 RepID=UPI0020C2304E|nr:pitrilysin family protein [Azonexus fungiphilus]
MKRLLTAIIVLAAAPLALAGVTIEQWTTANGARVNFVAAPALPMLDVQIDFAAGSMFDPEGKAGLAALTRGVLDLGAGERDETAIAEQLADLGAALGGSADTDRASVTLRTLTARDKLEPALAVLRDVLHRPHFAAAVLEREQARTVTGLKEAMTRPDSIAGKAFWEALYPGHPYGRQATPESVAALTRADLVDFHQRLYTAGNASISLVGQLTRAQAERIAEQLSSALPAGTPPALPAAPAPARAATQAIAHPASQAHIYLGLPAIERGHPDFYPLLVGNYTLGGGGFVSRLVQEVRDKRGFAYSVYSYFAPMRQAGPFQIGLQTQRKQAREAIKVVRQVLGDFVARGPSAEELAAAKANLSGSFPLRLDSNAKLLANVAVIGFYGLPADYLDHYQANIEAVTVDDVKAAFSRHVRPADLVTVTVAAD